MNDSVNQPVCPSFFLPTLSTYLTSPSHQRYLTQ